VPCPPKVLRNPVYFLFLLLLGAGAYVTYTLNLWGPMINMANAASKQALEEGKKRLREFLEASDTGRQAMAMPATGHHDRSNRDHHAESYELMSTSKTRHRHDHERDPAGEPEDVDDI
jgi:protein SEY1